VQATKAEQDLAQFVSVVLADNEQIWGEIFRQNESVYRKPVMVLFRNATQSPCGAAS
jgi:Predicted metalloprotease